MNLLYGLVLILGFGSMAQAAPPDDARQCKISCSRCQDMQPRQRCLQNCRGVVNTSACQAAVPVIKSPTDANNYGSEMFKGFKASLFESIPTVQSVIENEGSVFTGTQSNSPIDKQLVLDTKEYLQRFGAHAAKFVMNVEFLAKKNGSNVDAVMQIKSMLEKALKSTHVLDHQKFNTLGDLRQYANGILLNYKNIFGQGNTLKYVIENAPKKANAVAGTKGVSKAMLCKLQCRAGSCGKSAALTAKCMVNCDPKKIANCTAAAQKTGAYEKAKELLNIIQEH